MTVTGCANCAEMDEECRQLRDEMRDMEADKQKKIDALEDRLRELGSTILYDR